MSFLVCELSGEAMSLHGGGTPDNSSSSSSNNTIVITPSGHVCRKHLLLQKLRDNGGIDPFVIDDYLHHPLKEDDLIVLYQQQPTTSNGATTSTSTSTVVLPPPRNFMNHSMTSSIQQIQIEYDHLLLELYDTKQLLQTTQQELSLAMYQNDAAVRVVARIAAERDAAMQQLQQWKLSLPPTNVNTSTTTTVVVGNNADEEIDGPASKKLKLSSDEINGNNPPTSITTKIPDIDHQCMIDTWESLHASRKTRQKTALTLANTLDFGVTTNDGTNCKHHTIVAMTNDKNKPRQILPQMTSDTTVTASSSSLKLYTTTSVPDGSDDIPMDTLVNFVSASTGSTSNGDTTTDHPQCCYYYTAITYDSRDKEPTKKARNAKDHYTTTNLTIDTNNNDENQYHHHCGFDTIQSINNGSSFMVTAAVVQYRRGDDSSSNNSNDNDKTNPATFRHQIVLYKNRTTTTTTTKAKKTKDNKNSVTVAVGECTIVPNSTTDEPTTTISSGGGSDMIVDVQLHPDQQHIIVATQSGTIYIIKYQQQGTSSGNTNNNDDEESQDKYILSVIAQFTCPSELLLSTVTAAAADGGGNTNTVGRNIYSAATLHPDGLIYVTAVRTTGDLLLWDFKSQQLAGTLSYPTDDDDVGGGESPNASREISSLEFSNNGYHLAVAYKETGMIYIWDLRKQSVLVTLNGTTTAADDERLDNVVSVKFDDSGKYLAYSGNIGKDLIVAITTMKKWDRTATFSCPNIEATHGLLWSKNVQYIAVSAIQRNEATNEASPRVVFFDL